MGIERTAPFLAAEDQNAAALVLGLTLDELSGSLPAQKDGPPAHTIPGVGRYREICSTKGWSHAHQTPTEAIHEWRGRLLAYVAKHGGDTLWWRERPEIRGRSRLGWFVYSRLITGNAVDAECP